MTYVTNHVLAHWEGRCRQWAPPRRQGDHYRIEAKEFLTEIIEAGRMATAQEAWAASLFVCRATTWADSRGHRFTPGQCIVSEAYGVLFCLEFNDQTAYVVTCVRLPRVLRWAAGLRGSKMRPQEVGA